jgi:hypothetical protein
MVVADPIRDRRAMSDREDDKPINIEDDAPEADWIEQHEPIDVDDDAEAFTTAVREAADTVSIESDAPEADWIEQHQPIVEAPVEEGLPSDDPPNEAVEVGDLEQDRIATDEDVEATDDQGIPTPPVTSGGRGCNVLAAVARIVLHRGRDVARQLQSSSQRPRN